MYEVTCDKCGKTFSCDSDLEQHQFVEQMQSILEKTGTAQSRGFNAIYFSMRVSQIMQIMELKHCAVEEAFKIHTELEHRIDELQGEENARSKSEQ